MTDNSDEAAHPEPFLSWAGSKRKLIHHLSPFFPKAFDKYYEPFLGGGSVFFYLQPKRAEISDLSAALVETYRAVRSSPEAILDILRPLRPTKKNFEAMKAKTPVSKAGRGAQFIFLNKTCWNGLYRVNSAGIFNVPFGSPKSDFVVDEDNLLACAKQLRRREITIECQDFEDIGDRAEVGDFVFLDPPYITSHNLNGFADWNERLFSWKDQIRLAAMATKLVEKGVNVLITNADHDDVRRLYANFASHSFQRHSTLANDTTKRRRTSELIIFGGPYYRYAKINRSEAAHGSERRAS